MVSDSTICDAAVSFLFFDVNLKMASFLQLERKTSVALETALMTVISRLYVSIVVGLNQ